MAEGHNFGIAHFAAIIDRCMAVDIENDIIALARNRADDAKVRLIARGKDHRMVHSVKFFQRVFAFLVALKCAVQNAAAGRTCAKFVQSLLARGDDIIVKGHAHIIIGAKQDGFLAVHHSNGRRFHLFHHQAERVFYARGQQAFTLRNQGIKFGE